MPACVDCCVSYWIEFICLLFWVSALKAENQLTVYLPILHNHKEMSEGTVYYVTTTNKFRQIENFEKFYFFWNSNVLIPYTCEITHKFTDNSFSFAFQKY